MALQCRQAKKVRDGSLNHKIDYVVEVYDSYNLKGLKSCIIDSKVMEILLYVWTFPIGGAASGRVSA